MDRYHIALFLHLLALLAAVSASAVVHLALGRRMRARSVREVLEWHGVLTKTATTFPIALVVLVLTGSYMVGTVTRVWTAGFVIGGFAAAAYLLAAGAILGAKGRALKAQLDQLVSAGQGDQPPQLTPDPVAAALVRVNIAVVLATVFDMTLKPTVAGALGVLALAATVAACAGLVARPRLAARELPAE